MEEFNKKKQRLEECYQYLLKNGIVKNKSAVAKKMNYDRSSVSCALNGNELYLTDSFIDRFTKTFRQISKKWLCCGEGEMIISESDLVIDRKSPIVLYADNDDKIVISRTELDFYKTEMKSLRKQVQQLQNTIGQLAVAVASSQNEETVFPTGVADRQARNQYKIK